MSPRWVISGGGTGGHVTPALALGEVLQEAGDEILFVGTERGLEGRLVPAAGFELALLDARPLVGRSPLERMRSLLALLGAVSHARRLLARFRADLVIAVGGYASVPAALAAVLRRTPMVLVNTDLRPGVANRWLARFASRIFVGFAPAAAHFGPKRVVVSGVPLRRALRRAFAGPRPEKGPGAPPRLFVFGGSQGARQINDVMIAAAPALARLERPPQLVHQTGENDRERVQEAYRAAGLAARVLAFETDMPARYLEADLVVCRAGAISIAELTLAGRASLLVPLAHVGGGEQLDNARVLEQTGAARVLDPRSLSPEGFCKELLDLLGQPEALARMGAAAARLARPDAAETIVQSCRGLLETRR